MKNLIAELLLKLAEKEEESKELVVQVEALEIVLTAMLRRLDAAQVSDIAAGIDRAMPPAAYHLHAPAPDRIDRLAPGAEDQAAQLRRKVAQPPARIIPPYAHRFFSALLIPCHA